MISGGPYTSSATYECDVNNLAGPDNLVVLDDGRVLVGEDTGKHENNMVWLWEPTTEPEIGNGESSETITVNHVVQVESPPNLIYYSYQTEVNTLQMNVNYTAVILIKQIGNDEWGGLDWWWDDIESDGDQYNITFALQKGCYFINSSLYESGDLNSDVENATVLAAADLDFVVGTGTCVDGVYSEEVEVTEANPGPQDGADDDAGGLPGFGFILSITAALGAALIATRRE